MLFNCIVFEALDSFLTQPTIELIWINSQTHNFSSLSKTLVGAPIYFPQNPSRIQYIKKKFSFIDFFDKHEPGFDLSLWNAVAKTFSTNLSFRELLLGVEGKKCLLQKIFLYIGQHISHSYWKKIIASN